MEEEKNEMEIGGDGLRKGKEGKKYMDIRWIKEGKKYIDIRWIKKGKKYMDI